MTRRVAVIGGGISGLAAAFRMADLGGAHTLTLFEASARLGGVIESERRDGVVLEGGPDSSLRRKPEFLELVQRLGLGARIMGTNPKVQGSYIFHRGHFYDIPGGIQAGVPTRWDSLWSTELLSLGEKVRLWGDLVIPCRGDSTDIALGALLRRRFGDGYVDRIASPILAGIYAGDIDRLSTAVLAPSLLTFQSRGRGLLRGARADGGRMTTGGAAGQSLFVSLATGMESLIAALHSALKNNVDIRLNSPVVSLVPIDGGFRVVLRDGSPMHFDDVVLAVPAYQAAQILTFIDPEARKRLAGIEYADLAVVGAIYHGQAFNRPLTRTGYLVPRGEGLEMTASTWVRAKWDYADPSEDVPIRAFFGRSGQDDFLRRTDEEILATCRQELGFIMGVTDAPRYARVFRIPHGMPQFHVGHQQVVRQIRDEISRWRGLKLIGSYFDGVGLSDCIRHANQAAEELVPVSVQPSFSTL